MWFLEAGDSNLFSLFSSAKDSSGLAPISVTSISKSGLSMKVDSFEDKNCSLSAVVLSMNSLEFEVFNSFIFSHLGEIRFWEIADFLFDFDDSDLLEVFLGVGLTMS